MNRLSDIFDDAIALIRTKQFQHQTADTVDSKQKYLKETKI